MSTRIVQNPTARVGFGFARADVTPPDRIYHRLWGAARHDRATGVHRPLMAEVMVFAPIDGSGQPWIQAEFDLVGLPRPAHEATRKAMAKASGVPEERIILAFSHTHSSGWFEPSVINLPGGELVLGYLNDLEAKMAETAGAAMKTIQDATITFAVGSCTMAVNRDYWDEQFNGYTCGYNPDGQHDQTLIVGRVTDADGKLLATLFNYAAHPTTLAWLNSKISPDYPGEAKATVERLSGAPAVFVQGCCGDQAPRHGYVGDPAIADKNGRQLGLAALSVLEGMDPPLTDFVYRGPVISGATLGDWLPAPMTAERLAQTAIFQGGIFEAVLPIKKKPDAGALEKQRQEWLEKQRQADAAGDPIAARDYGARAERARRWLGQLDAIPNAPTYTMDFSILRMGNAIWVSVGGEPYNLLQRELRERFPNNLVIVSPLADHDQVAYLLPADRYGAGLYQEEPSITGKGSLEALIEAATAGIKSLL